MRRLRALSLCLARPSSTPSRLHSFLPLCHAPCKGATHNAYPLISSLKAPRPLVIVLLSLYSLSRFSEVLDPQLLTGVTVPKLLPNLQCLAAVGD